MHNFHNIKTALLQELHLLLLGQKAYCQYIIFQYLTLTRTNTHTVFQC